MLCCKKTILGHKLMLLRCFLLSSYHFFKYSCSVQFFQCYISVCDGCVYSDPLLPSPYLPFCTFRLSNSFLITRFLQLPSSSPSYRILTSSLYSRTYFPLLSPISSHFHSSFSYKQTDIQIHTKLQSILTPFFPSTPKQINGLIDRHQVYATALIDALTPILTRIAAHFPISAPNTVFANYQATQQADHHSTRHPFPPPFPSSTFCFHSSSPILYLSRIHFILLLKPLLSSLFFPIFYLVIIFFCLPSSSPPGRILPHPLHSSTSFSFIHSIHHS